MFSLTFSAKSLIFNIKFGAKLNIAKRSQSVQRSQMELMEGPMATLQDIALAVGVTPTTVANALKGRGNVSEAMRERILQCARELNYRPNMLARSLAQGKTYTLGFILPTIANP